MGNKEMDKLPEQCFEPWGGLKECCSNQFLYNEKTGKYLLADFTPPPEHPDNGE